MCIRDRAQTVGRDKGQTDRYRGTDSREGLGTDRKIQRHRQSGGTRDRQKDTEAQPGRQTEGEREDRQIQRHRQTVGRGKEQTDRYRGTDRQADRRGKEQTDRKSGTNKQSGVGGARNRQTDTERQRLQTDRQTDRDGGAGAEFYD